VERFFFTCTPLPVTLPPKKLPDVAFFFLLVPFHYAGRFSPHTPLWEFVLLFLANTVVIASAPSVFFSPRVFYGFHLVFLGQDVSLLPDCSGLRFPRRDPTSPPTG